MSRKLALGPLAMRCLVLDCADLLGPTFYLEDLVVKCWNVFPDQFAMKEFPNYPDANRVRVSLQQTNGPIQMGWIVPIGRKAHGCQRKYRITVAGRERIKEMEREKAELQAQWARIQKARQQ